MVVLANLLLLASLFTPLNLYVMTFFMAIMAVPYFLKHSEYAINGFSVNLTTGCSIFVITLLVAAFTAVGMDIVEDTGAYHHQMIKWLSEYGSVKGLALINNNFGFTNSWFALIAPLQTGWLKNHFITGMNGFIFYLMTVQTVLILRRILNFDHAAGVKDWFVVIAFVLFCRYSFSDLIISPSPDVPVTMLILIVSWLIITISVNGHAVIGNGAIRLGAGILVLACGAVSFKLGALPLLGIAIIYSVFAGGFTLRKLFTTIAIVAPFAAIHLWVSIITSGCPLYPAPYFCTDLPWSLGSENARSLSAAAAESLKWMGPAPLDSAGFNWLWHEPPNNNIFNDKPLMLILLVVNILCGVCLYIMRNKINKEALIYISLSAVIGIAFTIFKLPHLRFGLGFFLIAPVLTCASILMRLYHSQKKSFSYLTKFKIPLLIIAVYFTVLPMAIHFRNYQFANIPFGDIVDIMIKLSPRLAIWPIDAKHPAILAIHKGNNFIYYRPTKSVGPTELPLCWGSPLPCAQGVLGQVWLKDEKAGLSEGFIKVVPH